VCRMRLISKQIAHGVLAAFERVLVKNRTIYPRYDSLAHFAFLLRAFKSLDSHVRSVCLVAEGLKVHEYGSVWAWEDFLQWEGVECTAKDLDIIDKINADHENELSMTDAFIHRGSYRAMLGQLLSECPNLEVINVRKLKVSIYKNATLPSTDILFYSQENRFLVGLVPPSSRSCPSIALTWTPSSYTTVTGSTTPCTTVSPCTRTNSATTSSSPALVPKLASPKT
jgi:hypothetical protein